MDRWRGVQVPVRYGIFAGRILAGVGGGDVIHWIWIPVSVFAGAFMTLLALGLCRAGRDD